MSVATKEVSYVADLAHLELTADERNRMMRDLNAILQHIDLLNELDTSDITPMNAAPVPAHGEQEDGGIASTLREDVSRPSLTHEQALANAAAHSVDFFRVPRVIER